ncbi:hypothetical protein JN11_04252 [Mucilaginibacter frigoritolerans]|uniref:Uncharacterized protein n=2 Tax=Mucilaginibacter frigoritolerans TaxID=652788 RepID=A0A562TQV3_9SPHI|nr:hypothetical protein JN11_04252 [Mucilaginibacter frigoritolerans]
MLLNLYYELLEHPYKDSSSSIGEHWSRIKLEILDDEKLLKTAFDIQWDLTVFLEWFLENEKTLLYEDIPTNINGTSIAKGVYDFYEKLDPDTIDEALINQVYDYRTRHEIWFALRGAKNVDNIFIGLLDSKITISFCNDINEWSYDVEVASFFKKVHLAFKEISSSI